MNQLKDALSKINFGQKSTVYIRAYTAEKGKLWIRHKETKKPLLDAKPLDLTLEYKPNQLERLMAEIALVRDQWEKDFFGGTMLPTEESDSKPPATLQAIIAKWNTTFTVRQTINNNTSYMAKVTKVLGKTRELRSITQEHVRNVLIDLQSQGLHQNSQRYVMKKFRTFMLWCVEEKLIEKAPSFKKLVPTEIFERRAFLSAEQIASIAAVKFKHPNVQDCFLFACYTGCRIGEARKLTWKELDLTHGTYKRWQQKKLCYVDVPLSPYALAILYRHEKKNDKVFQVPVDQVFNRHYKTLLKEAEVVTEAKARNGRSTFARMAIRSKVEPSVAMELLGQTNPRTILTYYNEYDLADKQDALTKMQGAYKVKPTKAKKPR